MIDRTQKELNSLAQIVSRYKNDTLCIDIASYRDAGGNLHTFVYDTNDEELCSLKLHLEKIFNVFTEDEMTKAFWGNLIDNFETKYDIDFFMLMSYVYMLNISVSTSDRAISVVGQIGSILMREGIFMNMK